MSLYTLSLSTLHFLSNLYLPNLQELFLYDNQITDISPLSSLTNLTYLNISYNKIIDISPLSHLTNLTHLDITHNNISDISSLSHLIDLKALYLYDNNQLIHTQVKKLRTQSPHCVIFFHSIHSLKGVL